METTSRFLFSTSSVKSTLVMTMPLVEPTTAGIPVFAPEVLYHQASTDDWPAMVLAASAAGDASYTIGGTPGRAAESTGRMLPKQ